MTPMRAKIKYPKRQNMGILLERLESITSVKSDGSLKFSSFEIENLEWLLLSIIEFGDFLSIHSKKRILNDTIKQMSLSSDFSENSFFNNLDQQIQAHNKCKPQPFILLTTLSIANLPFRKIKIGEGIIRIHGKQFPSKFRKPRNEILSNYPPKKDNTTYCSISVEVLAKESMDAYEKAFFCLEVFRSLLCLILNSTFEIRFGDSDLKPINKVRQGQYSTLHYENGESFDDKIHWYVPNYIEAQVLQLDSKLKIAVKSVTIRLLTQYNKCKSGHQLAIGKALINYGGAFDERNKHIAFLRAWTVLETLTNTDQNDLLIKRCIVLHSEENKPYQKQSLESLRTFRNEYVHEGDNGLDPLFACFQAQLAIYNLIIRFNLEYSGFFNNIEDSVIFLDNYNSDIKELERRNRILKRAIGMKNKNTKR